MPWCGHSPAELLMGRQLRTQVPRVQEQFIPEWSYLKELKKQHKAYKEKQADYYDVSHRVRERPDLGIGSEVWVTNLDDKRQPTRGVVSSQAETPRSYVVHTPSGPLRRNSQHLRTVPEERTAPEGPIPEDGQPPRETTNPLPPVRSPVMTRQRSGIKLQPPLRYQGDDNENN